MSMFFVLYLSVRVVTPVISTKGESDRRDIILKRHFNREGAVKRSA
jgi:hypothetical protein